MHSFRYEVIMWGIAILKVIPGKLGCMLRRVFLPIHRGRNVLIWDHVHIDSPSRLSIGCNVSINRGGVINAGGYINIGSNVLIGPNCLIYSQNHRYEEVGTLIKDQGYDLSSVSIGNNVWIAGNVIILPGVTIGDNVVVGAGSVVVKSVPDNVVVAGNPAKVIKRLAP